MKVKTYRRTESSVSYEEIWLDLWRIFGATSLDHRFSFGNRKHRWQQQINYM